MKKLIIIAVSLLTLSVYTTKAQIQTRTVYQPDAPSQWPKQVQVINMDLHNMIEIMHTGFSDFKLLIGKLGYTLSLDPDAPLYWDNQVYGDGINKEEGQVTYFWCAPHQDQKDKFKDELSKYYTGKHSHNGAAIYEMLVQNEKYQVYFYESTAVMKKIYN